MEYISALHLHVKSIYHEDRIPTQDHHPEAMS